MLKRHTTPLHVTSTARSSLATSSHGAVDAVLKVLKNCSRRLSLALSAFADEYSVLERLYYKGKNQHRVSLFWRRVTEIRRFCDRLDGLHLDQVLGTLRASFFSSGDVESNPKMMRGSWTHFPEPPTVDLVLHRLHMGLVLLEKMQERLLECYRSFTLAMQSGAFLQLILTLVAVASRMKAICEELQQTLQATITTARRIPEIFSTAKISSKNICLSMAVEDQDTIIMGSSPSQPSVIEPETTSPIISEALLAAPPPPARTTVHREVKEVKALAKIKVGKPANKKSIPKMKEKKSRDEIDDIFGF